MSERPCLILLLLFSFFLVGFSRSTAAGLEQSSSSKRAPSSSFLFSPSVSLLCFDLFILLFFFFFFFFFHPPGRWSRPTNYFYTGVCVYVCVRCVYTHRKGGGERERENNTLGYESVYVERGEEEEEEETQWGRRK